MNEERSRKKLLKHSKTNFAMLRFYHSLKAMTTLWSIVMPPYKVSVMSLCNGEKSLPMPRVSYGYMRLITQLMISSLQLLFMLLSNGDITFSVVVASILTSSESEVSVHTT